MLSIGIRKEFQSLSRWFVRTLAVIGVIYVSLWLYTIHISAQQQTMHMSPTLPVLAKDSLEYSNLAQSLISGNGFTQGGQLETLRTPGYPFFVAVIETVGRSNFVVTFVQIFMMFVSALIIRRIGMHFASQRVGEITAVMFLINPVTLTLTLLIYSDPLFLLLFTGGFLAAMSLEEKHFLPRILLASLLFGLAVYVRPIGLFAIPIFIAPILASRLTTGLKWKAAGILLVCLLLLITPWMLRNYARTGVFSFTSIEAFNLNWAAGRFLANENGITFAAVNKELEKKIGAPESAWRDIRLSQKENSVAEDIIFAQPFSYALYHGVSSLPFLFPSTISFSWEVYTAALNLKQPSAPGAIQSLTAGNVHAFYQSIMKVWWKVAERMVWFGILLIALYAVWHRRREVLAWVLLFVIGYLMLLAGPAAGPRYSFQAFPFFFILFVSGCGYLCGIFKRFTSS